MTGERDFTEADAARVAQFRNALDALRLYLPCIEDDYVRTAMVSLINALDGLTAVRQGR